MLYAFGIGDIPISISSDVKNDKCYRHTIKIVGNVTRALSRLDVGQQVGIRGPFGSSWPIESCKNKNVVLIAGGIGIAPLRPMIHHLLNYRKDYGEIALLYGAREPADIVFMEELKQWKEQLGGRVYITVDVANENWKGNVGVVTKLISHIPFSLKNSTALLCGPEIMLRFSAGELLQKEIDASDIYLAMERNMKCAIGHCGRCQYLSNFICKDGSILPYEKVKPFFAKKEI